MDKRQRFRELHAGSFLIPNPWDVGSTRILGSLGFQALATTSAGFAATLGRQGGDVTREEAIGHAEVIVGATTLPVSADLENGFGDSPDAVDASRRASSPLVLTARAENYLRGNPDLADTIARLQSYQETGADVLYAPGLSDLDDIRSIVAVVDRPLNVLVLPGGPTVAEIFEAGVARISVGSAFNLAANAALVEPAHEILGPGTTGFWTKALESAGPINEAFKATD